MKLNDKQGFTLVELLVGMSLTLTLLGAVYGVYRVQARTLKVQDERLTAQEYARTVADLIVREVRNTGYDPSSVAGCGIVAASSTSLQFTYDADTNGSCTSSQANENITYSFSTTNCSNGYGNIMRQDGTNTPEALTDCNVPTGTANFSFTYFPKDSTTAYTSSELAANLGNIQRVKVTITVQSKYPDPVFGGQLNATITSNADLRNRGLS